MIFRTAVLLWLAAASCSAQKVQIDFEPVGRGVIERHLTAAPASNAARDAGLRALFEEAGCRGGMLSGQPVKRARQANILCSAAGETGSTIIVGAHFDFSEEGRGIVDNWTGASLLPALFESLRKTPRRHTFVFIGFTEEEKGLRGSDAFVRSLSRDAKRQIKAMVNLDSLGLSPTKVWLNGSDKELVKGLFAVASSLHFQAAVVNVEKVGSSDSQAFRNKGIPAVTIHSLTQETWQTVHSPSDTLAAVHMDEYYETYRLISAYLAYLDRVLE